MLNFVVYTVTTIFWKVNAIYVHIRQQIQAPSQEMWQTYSWDITVGVVAEFPTEIYMNIYRVTQKKREFWKTKQKFKKSKKKIYWQKLNH